MDFLQSASDINSYIVDMRRYFHTYPELKHHEQNTLKRIGEELDGMGISYVHVEKGGILAFIDGTGAGQTMLLRADIDALPITEEPVNSAGPRTCVSKNKGVMHACGHDSHMAMLLGAAKILNAHRDLFPGKIVLMFEQGEEGGRNIVHLLNYIQKKGIHIDTSWAMHNEPLLPVGSICVDPGLRMVASLFCEVTIKGKGGHSSRPDRINSPIDCLIAVLNAVNATRTKYTSPFIPVTMAISHVQAGSAESRTVVPMEASFCLSYRLGDTDTGHILIQKLERLINGICEAYECVAEIRFEKPYCTVNNDPVLTELARTAVSDVFGKDKLAHLPTVMGGESFGMTQTMFSGVFAFVGSGNPQKGTGPLHTPMYDIDEDALKYGSAATAAYAVYYLNHAIDTSAMQFHGTPRDLYAYLGQDQLLYAFDD